MNHNSETKKLTAWRVCASCEWVFKTLNNPSCPLCGFGSYSAHYVYGKKAYRYAKTQKPWKDKKLSAFEAKLDRKIQEMSPRVIRVTRPLAVGEVLHTTEPVSSVI